MESESDYGQPVLHGELGKRGCAAKAELIELLRISSFLGGIK